MFADWVHGHVGSFIHQCYSQSHIFFHTSFALKRLIHSSFGFKGVAIPYSFNITQKKYKQ